MKEPKKYIGGYCPSCHTQKEYGLCPNKKCDTWTFGNNLDDYDMFFDRAKEHYSKTETPIKGLRNYHARKSMCPTCHNPFRFENEPTRCDNCKQVLIWKK